LQETLAICQTPKIFESSPTTIISFRFKHCHFFCISSYFFFWWNLKLISQTCYYTKNNSHFFLGWIHS